MHGPFPPLVVVTSVGTASTRASLLVPRRPVQLATGAAFAARFFRFLRSAPQSLDFARV
jgi:hypothetical protein